MRIIVAFLHENFEKIQRKEMSKRSVSIWSIFMLLFSMKIYEQILNLAFIQGEIQRNSKIYMSNESDVLCKILVCIYLQKYKKWFFLQKIYFFMWLP